MIFLKLEVRVLRVRVKLPHCLLSTYPLHAHSVQYSIKVQLVTCDVCWLQSKTETTVLYLCESAYQYTAQTRGHVISSMCATWPVDAASWHVDACICMRVHVDVCVWLVIVWPQRA